MDIKDMMVEVVYESKDGMFPLDIAEAVSKRFQTPITTRQVEQIVQKNPKLFVEKNSRICSPSDF
jgi:hypothetical protein